MGRIQEKLRSLTEKQEETLFCLRVGCAEHAEECWSHPAGHEGSQHQHAEGDKAKTQEAKGPLAVPGATGRLILKLHRAGLLVTKG